MSWIVYAISSVFFYGVLWFLVKLAFRGSDPLQVQFVFIASQFFTQVALGAYLVQGRFEIRGESLKFGVLAGVAAAFGTIGVFLALENGPLVRVMPIINLNVVVGVLLAIVFLGEAVNFRVALGVLLAILSIYLLISN